MKWRNHLALAGLVLSGVTVAAMQRDWLFAGDHQAQVVAFVASIFVGAAGLLTLMGSVGAYLDGEGE